MICIPQSSTITADCLALYQGHTLKWGLLLCRDAVGVFFRYCRLSQLVKGVLPFCRGNPTILRPQLTWLTHWGVLLLCRDAVGVLCHPSRLTQLVGGVLNFCRAALGLFYRSSQLGRHIRGVLAFCRDTIGVFYNPTRLANSLVEFYLSAETQSVYSTVTIPPLPPPEYINFFETISIFADDHLVVPIGASHISLRHKKYNQGSERKRTNEQTKNILGLTQKQEGWFCDTVHSFLHM